MVKIKNTLFSAFLCFVFIILGTALSIIYPCLCESAFFEVRDMKEELSVCGGMFLFGIFKDVVNENAALNTGCEVEQFGFKCFSESLGSFIEIISPVSAYGEAVTHKKTEEQCYDRKQWIGNYFSNECYRHSDLAVFFILGYLSALVIKIIWEYFFHTTINIRTSLFPMI
jgi:hypothetical protein